MPADWTELLLALALPASLVRAAAVDGGQGWPAEFPRPCSAGQL